MTVTPDRILELGYRFRGAKVLLSAVELDVFTALAAGPLDLQSLTRKIDIAERGARDFFDALVALGVLQRDEEGRYSNDREVDCYLDRRKPTYLGGDLAHASERMYPHWQHLTAALRTGKPQSCAAGGDYFSRLYADHEAGSAFLKGMTGGSLLVARAIATTFPWHKYETLLDVGAAEGCLPVEIARAHPHVTGSGFDLPQVRPAFEAYAVQHGLADRLRFHSGNFLTDALPCADVIVMGRVLHNWDLATKTMLIGKAHGALRAGGALIVYERLIDDERRANAAGLLASLHMLIVTAGGFDFTAADCIGWMQEAGFRNMQVAPLPCGQSMIIAGK